MASALMVFIYILLACLVLLLCLRYSKEEYRYLCLAMFFYHGLISGFYYVFASNKEVDAFFYWRDALDYGCSQFSVGTGFVKCVSAFAMPVYVEYWALYILFSVAGFLGIWLFGCAAVKFNKNLERFWWFMFLPGLHFWTGGPGKDAINILGSGLFLWGLVSRNGYMCSLAGLVLIGLVRPHVAAILAVSWILTELFFRPGPIWKKAIVLLFFCLAGVVAYDYLSVYLSAYGDFSASDVGGFVESRQKMNQGGSGVDVAEYSWFEMIVSYLFRPLFFDASGGAGLLASLENFLLLLGLAWAVIVQVSRRCWSIDAAVFFSFFYSLSLLVVLSFTTTNVGLALRQKWMFLPFLIFALISMGLDRRVKL